MLAFFVSEETDQKLNKVVQSLTYNLAGESEFTEIEKQLKYHYYKTLDSEGNPYWMFVKYEWQNIPGRTVLYAKTVISAREDTKKSYDIFLLKFHRSLVLVINDIATNERTAVDMFPREVEIETVYGVQIHDTWSRVNTTRLHPAILTAVPLKVDNNGPKIDSQEKLGDEKNLMIDFLEKKWSDNNSRPQK
jgi:hypothetical protein